MLKSSLGDHSDACILAAIAADRNNKQAIFKNCALFTGCVTEINNTQVDNP